MSASLLSYSLRFSCASLWWASSSNFGRMAVMKSLSYAVVVSLAFLMVSDGCCWWLSWGLSLLGRGGSLY